MAFFRRALRCADIGLQSRQIAAREDQVFALGLQVAHCGKGAGVFGFP
jgi:hypothetical protein